MGGWFWKARGWARALGSIAAGIFGLYSYSFSFRFWDFDCASWRALPRAAFKAAIFGFGWTVGKDAGFDRRRGGIGTGASFFSFCRLAVNVKSIYDLITSPYLADLDGQEFADAKARANAEHDQRPISQRVLAVQVFQGQS